MSESHEIWFMAGGVAGMSTYPNEAWPAESTVLSVDGTLDTGTGLPFIAKGTGPTSSPSYEVQYNRRQMRENAILAGWRQGMVVDEGELKVGVYPISFTIAGVRKSYAGATGVSVPDDSTRVVYLDTAAVLQVASSWPTKLCDYLPLAEITTAYGVTSIEDRRVYSAFDVPMPDRWCVTAFYPQVGNSQTGLEVFEYRAPQGLVLEEVQVFCTATTSTTSIDVKEGGVSVLSAAATPVAGSVVRPTISDADIVSASSVSMCVTTNGSGSVTNLTVTLLFRPV